MAAERATDGRTAARQTARTIRRTAAAGLTALLLGTLAACGDAEPVSPTSGITEHNPDGMNGAVLDEQYVAPDITSALSRLEPEQRDKVGMLFITSDPARDDPATLRRYLDRFDPQFEGLTGDLDTIVEVADELGVPIEKGKKLPSGGYEVSHGTQIVALDAKDRSPIVWTEGTSAAALAEDLTAILDKSGDPT